MKSKRWKDPIGRFWQKVNKTEGCWEWKGTKVNGRGSVRWDGHSRAAHRIAWQITYGPIPKGMLICHHCDNLLCVRPSHLFLGTAQDNANDKVAKGRQPRGELQARRGETNGRAKLTAAAVREIRQLYTRGVTQAALAKRFGTSRYNMWNIVHRKTWRHIS